jgi:4-oxalocrotonate tautomerase
MPFITVEMWEGRTPEQKKDIVKDITATFLKIGIPANQIHIVLKDNKKENWGINGMLASEQ